MGESGSVGMIPCGMLLLSLHLLNTFLARSLILLVLPPACLLWFTLSMILFYEDNCGKIWPHFSFVLVILLGV